MTSMSRMAILALGYLFAAPGMDAWAATITWANNAASTNWGASASWTGGRVPGADDTASVPRGGVRPFVDAADTHAVRGIALFARDGHVCSLNGTGTLVLGAGGLTITVEVGSGGTSGTLQPAFVLAVNQSWSVGGGGAAIFTFDGALSDAGSARALTLGGGGVAVFNHGGSTFGGGFTRTAGTLRLGAGSTLGTDGTVLQGPVGTGPLTLAGVVLSDIANRTLHNPLVIAGNVRFGRDGQTFWTVTFAPSTNATPTAALLHAAADGTQHVVTLFNNRQNPTISQAIGEAGATGLGLVVTNGTGTGSTTTGQLTLSGATPNTFRGTVSVRGAILRLAKTAGVAAVGGNVELTGGRLVLAAAEQIPDTARFSVATTAAPILEFTGAFTESVAQLWVDGVRMPPGNYARTGSGSGATEVAWIAGSGVLRVLPNAATLVLVR